MDLIRRVRWHLADFLTAHAGQVLLLATLFTVGVVFGAMAVRSLEERDKLELVSYLGRALPSLRQAPDGSGALLLKQALLTKAKLLALFFVLGISVVGSLGAMLMVLLRGFVSGFVVAFLAANLGGPGVMLAVAGHLPQSLLDVPAQILSAAAAVSFSTAVVRSWRDGRRVPNFYPALSAYTSTLAVAGTLLFGAALMESYLSPVLIQLVARLVHSQ